MKKQITDAEDISKNYDVICEVTKGKAFSVKWSAWDKIWETSYEDLKSGFHSQRGEADGKRRKSDGQQSRGRGQIQKKR